MVSVEEFAEWKEHPVTKEIFKQLKNEKEILKTKLAAGFTINESAESTHFLTSKTVGQLEGINQLLNIHFAAKEDQENDNEQTGY